MNHLKELIIHGYPIMLNPYLVLEKTIQTRYPKRHKKKNKVIKKFKKLYSKKVTVPNTENFIMMGNTIIVHPILYNRLLHEIREHQYA